MSVVARQQPAFCPPDGEPLDRGVSFAGIGLRPACSQQLFGFVERIDGVSESQLRARVFSAVPTRPSSTLENRRLCQARPVIPREKLGGPVQVLQRLVDEALGGTPLS